MSKLNIRLIDRTRTVQDWKCARSRYWGYEYLGRGLVKQGTSLELFLGIVTHDAMAAIATFWLNHNKVVPIDDIADAAYRQVFENIAAASQNEPHLEENMEFAKEQGTLVEGMIRGFYKHVWPKLMSEYTIVAIEAEMEYPLDPKGQFIFMTKPDLIVENSEGELVYIEYKTTSSKKESWIKSWDTAVQLHSSIKATELTLGRKASHVQIMGLYKGWESYGKQSSPFCYAYKKSGNPPFTQDQVQYDYKAGFRRYPTWELEGGVKKWIDDMPDIVLADQFPQTPPIFVNDALVERFFAQRLEREKEIYQGTIDLEADPPAETVILDEVFPQKFDQCQPSFGYACPFRKLCHSEVKDPLSEGFELRQPHHSRELEMFNAKEN